MKNLAINELHPTVQNFVKGYNLEGYLDGSNNVKLTDKREDAMTLAANIVSVSGLSKRLQKCFLTGYDKTIKSDGEYYGSSNGISTMYDGYQIQAAIVFADRYLKGETRIEVGMKYPTFSLAKFKKLFNLGEAVKVKHYTTSSGEDLFYDVYTDDKGNVFSFQDGATIGTTIGYAGAVLVNESEALKLVDFLCGSKSHYVKDLDIGYNGLGGFGIDDLDTKATEFNAAAWVAA